MNEPTWMKAARSQIGVREIPGPKHSPGVMGMVARAAGWLGISVKDDETAWCGTFVASCMAAAGFTPPRGAIAVRASWWGTWGQALPTAGNPPRGAIAVFSRNGGGHVGFVDSVNKDGSLNILGGNQGNAVNIRRFTRDRLTAFRWPTGVPVPKTQAPIAKVASANTTGEA